MTTPGAPPALARDPDARTFWSTIFGNDAPVEIEIGSGDGTFLLTRATATPIRNVLGIERAPAKARRLAARVARLAVPHVRMLQADAACVLAIVPRASVAAYHVYFPDPWPKRRHLRRRIFTAAFVRALGRTLALGGDLYVATDVGPYMRLIRAAILAGAFTEVEATADHPGLTTAFARKYCAEGRPLHFARFARTSRARRLAPQPAARGAAASKIRSS
jgi:tRNA (guanine-N7-)-methyltransferase